MGKLVSIVTTIFGHFENENILRLKVLSYRFKWVFWTIHNYNYENNGVVLLIYLVSG